MLNDAGYRTVVSYLRGYHPDTIVAGREPNEIPADARAALKATLRQNTPQAYWDGAVRLLLRDEPEVLT